MTNRRNLVKAADDALGKQEPGCELTIAPRSAHRHHKS
jgi:hypothetical protein